MIDEKLIERVRTTRELYRDKNAADGHQPWTVTDYMSGYVKDVGDLSMLIMVKSGLREYEGDIDAALRHEIGDCFWSLFVLCDELNINPQEALNQTLEDIERRFK